MAFTEFKNYATRFNFGNKSGAVARKVGLGKVVEMNVYDLKEIIPPIDGYDGKPYLYLICEYDGKKGIRVRCNDEDCIKAILDSGKDEYTVTVKSEEFASADGKTKRPYLSLESYA